MRVLWITSELPNPRAGAGEALEFELLRCVSSDHDVHVISAELDEGGRSLALESIGVSHEGVSWRATPLPRNRLAMLCRLATRDSAVVYWRLGDKLTALGEAADRFEATQHPDLVQVVMGDGAPLLRKAGRPRALLLFDSFERQIERELASATRIRDRVLWTAQLSKMRSWERRWYPLADEIACNSSTDAAALSSTLKRRVEVIPNPIPHAFFAEPSVARSSSCVSFIATLDYRPNVDAAIWLTTEIWPRVVARCPQARLRLVGRNPVPEVRAAAGCVAAEVFANVDDVRPFYWESAVAVAPIRLGSGLRNKVLHSMACGAPLVSTSTALEGMELDASKLFVADEAVSFAEAIVRALGDRAEAERRAREGKAFAARFHPDKVGSALGQWWSRAALAACEDP